MLGETGSRDLEKAVLFGELPEDYLRDWQITSDLDLLQRKAGVTVESISREVLRDTYLDVGQREAPKIRDVAEEFASDAQQSDDAPPRGSVRNAVQLYMAMRNLLRSAEASGASIVCSPWIEGPEPVPCVALTFLRERGIPAACQGDIDALVTMMFLRRVQPNPTFMGGAELHEGLLRISHCVLPRNMANRSIFLPYQLGDYHGRRRSPTIRTKIPTGKTATVARLSRNLESLLLGRGKVVECLDLPDHCRNTVVLEMERPEELMEHVPGVQYHLVMACGDHTGQMSELARDRDIEVVRT